MQRCEDKALVVVGRSGRVTAHVDSALRISGHQSREPRAAQSSSSAPCSAASRSGAVASRRCGTTRLVEGTACRVGVCVCDSRRPREKSHESYGEGGDLDCCGEVEPDYLRQSSNRKGAVDPSPTIWLPLYRKCNTSNPSPYVASQWMLLAWFSLPKALTMRSLSASSPLMTGFASSAVFPLAP